MDTHSQAPQNTTQADCINRLPLAMAYVPMQRFCDIYTPQEALDNGTLFAELNKPFMGKFVDRR
ncbi:MAG: spore coat associated protein CotJA [Clostridia bacterium]|nr:spore coat associated protein CotJA [Clostridia bacterium]MBQ7289256.1 spore coat associated protein CotJA [Clostridia bacterium]